MTRSERVAFEAHIAMLRSSEQLLRASALLIRHVSTSDADVAAAADHVARLVQQAERRMEAG
jgi:hypothetical protein